MTKQILPPELEARITELEREENQGSGFTGSDWAFLALVGVILPALLLAWGWM